MSEMWLVNAYQNGKPLATTLWFLGGALLFALCEPLLPEPNVDGAVGGEGGNGEDATAKDDTHKGGPKARRLLRLGAR